MFQPIITPSTTNALGAPVGWDASKNGECIGLPVTRSNETWFSFWKVSFADRLRILFGKPILLGVMSAGHPPVSIQVSE